MALLSIVAANLIFPALLVLRRPDDPWGAFEGEASPITWFSTVQCALAGCIALAVHFVSRAAPRSPTRGRGSAWPWFTAGLGCFLMSLDEQFEVHERLRDEVLVPHGILVGLPGLKDGDVLVLGYVVAGAALCLFLHRDLRRVRASLHLFVAALITSGAAALLDAGSAPGLEDPPRVAIAAEEIGEIWAQALFAGSAILVLAARLRDISRSAGGIDTGSAPPPVE